MSIKFGYFGISPLLNLKCVFGLMCPPQTFPTMIHIFEPCGPYPILSYGMVISDMIFREIGSDKGVYKLRKISIFAIG